MAQAQKPDFVFRRKRRVHLSRRGSQFNRLLAGEAVRISGSNGSNAGYMVRGSVKDTGTQSIRQFSPSLPSRASPCAITF